MNPLAMIGSVISDRYELVEFLKQGGMGVVFKAWDKQKQYSVVIKFAVSKSGFAIEESIERIKREALALQRVDDPHVVRLLDSGYFEGTYFLVLEYIQGRSLADCLDNGVDFSIDASISVAIDMLEGLEAIHKNGLVHRDIKPNNLIISNFGTKIIDFGIVLFLSQPGQKIMRRLTIPGMMVGTLMCLSPEQASGHRDLDGRVDLYACGFVLYILLTGGILPFQDTLVENFAPARFSDVSLRKFSEIYPPLNIPEKVQAIVYKALRADRDLRYQTAAEMKNALLNELGTYTKIPVS